LKTLRETLASLRKAAASAAAEEDYIRHAVDELTALAPETGEEATLAATRSLLMNAGRVAEEVSAASDLLSGDKGAETQLASALKRLSRLNTDARQAAAGAEAALEQAFANAEEARHELDSLLARLERDPQELEKKEERLFAIRAVARKFAVQPDALPGLLEEFRTKLDALESGDEKIKTVEDEAARFTDCFLRAARALSAARGQAARALEAAVSKELAPLKLGHARFRVAFTAVSDEDAGANGSERVAFEIATVEGAAFGPLTRIASGGELARLSLALKVALSEAAPPAALVFDEVDRGVGGAVADAVGERLQRLAQRTQVLLVTHSPQVAARAARHFRITRKGDKTRVELLDDEARAEEVARMLSGAIVTEEARAAARRLIAEAQTPPAKKARKRA
jgi:DNA repair protein RecN (Recombination protein N)